MYLLLFGSILIHSSLYHQLYLIPSFPSTLSHPVFSLSLHLEQLWCECDDLRHPVVTHKHQRPKCRPKEVHLLIWEKASHLTTHKQTCLKPPHSELESPSSSNVASPALSLLASATESVPPSAESSRPGSRGSSVSSSDAVSAYRSAIVLGVLVLVLVVLLVSGNRRVCLRRCGVT